MKQKQDYIWYASYGSNILEERFLCYIKGGQPLGTTKTYLGCTDKSLPIYKEEIYINSELYFAKQSKTWGKGGVCFIKTNFDPHVQTLGRMYLITKQQFTDVVKQETTNENNLTINFENAISKGSLIFNEGSWYGNLIYLGTQNDFPIFTFTNQENIGETNKPSENYLRTITKGIQETYNLSTAEIVNYFISKSGIINNFTKEQLTKIVGGYDK